MVGYRIPQERAIQVMDELHLCGIIHEWWNVESCLFGDDDFAEIQVEERYGETLELLAKAE